MLSNAGPPLPPFDLTASVVAICMSMLVLSKQALDLFRGRRKEKQDIEEALERQPMVRDQLALGNVGEAVKVLNSIIATQERHALKQDEKISRQEEQIAELQGEVEKWRTMYEDLETRCDDLEATLIRLQNPQ